ncbi:type IV secretion system protein [Ruminococcus sp. XPD3002]|uniref:type IV secretion system protein n=1 Tax=Ruminococcus sp. XPD3002 TaxID=1452269 RepID=UPI00091AEEF4|nr:hypothetical protein SAMN04487832_1316 [Ruminococcus flavefaciens]
MKHIIALFFSIICVLSTLSLISASAKTEIAEGAEPNAVDIWNYINNDLPDAVQNGVMSQLVTTLNEQRAGAASQESVDNVQHSIDSIDVKRDSREALDEWAEGVKDETILKENKPLIFPMAAQALAEALWDKFIVNEISDEIKSTDYESGKQFNISIKPDSFTTITDILKTLGYSMVLLFFAISIIEQSIKYEIFTLKGGAMVFGRLLFAKVLIDSSVKICMAILKVINQNCSKILESVKVEMIDFPTITLDKSDVKIIGPLLDYVVGIIISIPLTMVYSIIMIAGICLSIKLLLRSFELAMLTSVSPAFFACFSSEVTRPYFRNFILTFIQVAAQILFMAIVLYIGKNATAVNTSFTVTSLNDIIKWFVQMAPRTFIIIAMTIMMIKPPKVLTGLIK